MSKNMIQRTSVAAVAIPAILFMVFRGGDLFLYFILLLAAIGIYEFLNRVGSKAVAAVTMISFVGSVGAVYLAATGQVVYALYALLGVFLLVGIIQAIGRDPVDKLYARMTYLIWCSAYIGILWPFVFWIRGRSEWLTPSPGQWWIFFLLGAIWLGDTAAMLFGSKWGSHKLAPSVSPNKTVEGFVGGFIGIFVVAAVFKLFWIKNVEIIHLLALSIVIGIFGQLGDLVESLWKRSLGIKDSSGIIPGHGGVLDRFDSLLFAAPPTWLYLKYILHAPWL
jgi:phosphatidate cytidylyltransferase